MPEKLSIIPDPGWKKIWKQLQEEAIASGVSIEDRMSGRYPDDLYDDIPPSEKMRENIKRRFKEGQGTERVNVCDGCSADCDR